jgi:hypothetical protein
MARALISEATNRFVADLAETREIDSVLIVGKAEPQRIFELLDGKGRVAGEYLALRDAFVEALEAYRRKDWEEARAGFKDCLAMVLGEWTEQGISEPHRSVSRHRAKCQLGRCLVSREKVGRPPRRTAICEAGTSARSENPTHKPATFSCLMPSDFFSPSRWWGGRDRAPSRRSPARAQLGPAPR